MSDRKPSVSELLRRIGDDNIEYQDLAANMTAYKAGSKRMGATITFRTEEAKAHDLAMGPWRGTGQGEYIGMVLWIKREDYVRVVAEFKAEQP